MRKARLSFKALFLEFLEVDEGSEKLGGSVDEFGELRRGQ
jgi:hypothetical protein